MQSIEDMRALLGTILMCSATALAAADESEQRYWRTDGEVTLRGRTTPTELASLHIG